MNLEELLSRLAYVADMYGGEGLPKETEVMMHIQGHPFPVECLTVRRTSKGYAVFFEPVDPGPGVYTVFKTNS